MVSFTLIFSCFLILFTLVVQQVNLPLHLCHHVLHKGHSLSWHSLGGTCYLSLSCSGGGWILTHYTLGTVLLVGQLTVSILFLFLIWLGLALDPSCLVSNIRLDAIDGELEVFLIKDLLSILYLLLHLLLRTQHYVVVVLHLAEAREHWHTDVTVTLDAVYRER